VPGIVLPDHIRLTRCPAMPSNRASAILLAAGTDAVMGEPSTTLPEKPTSAVVNPVGGMMKSEALTACPSGVATAILPEEAMRGTAVTRLVAVAEVAQAWVVLIVMRSLARTVEKFVPLMVKAVTGVPLPGVKPLKVGALDGPTVKGVELVADPEGLVTLIVPVVAPAGTVVVIWLAVD